VTHEHKVQFYGALSCIYTSSLVTVRMCLILRTAVQLVHMLSYNAIQCTDLYHCFKFCVHKPIEQD